MMKTQIILRNSADCELQRFDVERDEDGDINLMHEARMNEDLALALELLAPGDTIAIEEIEE
jgi:hypothetical protein